MCGEREEWGLKSMRKRMQNENENEDEDEFLWFFLCFAPSFSHLSVISVFSCFYLELKQELKRQGKRLPFAVACFTWI